MSFLVLLFFYGLTIFFLCESTSQSRHAFDNKAGPIWSFVGLMSLLYLDNPSSPYVFNLTFSSMGVLAIYLLWLFLSTGERILLALNLLPTLGLLITLFCLLKAAPSITPAERINILHFFLIALTIQFIYFMKDFKGIYDESFVIHSNDSHE